MRPGWEAFGHRITITCKLVLQREHLYRRFFGTHTFFSLSHYRMTEFMTESALRAEQDAEFGYEIQPSGRLLQGEQLPPFKPRITGINGEEPEESGPFLPLWQMTPILP